MKPDRQVVATIPDLQRRPGFIYFVDKQGDLSRTRRSTGHYRQKFPHHKVVDLGIQRKPGYWYYVDKLGQVIEFQPNPPKTRLARNSNHHAVSPDPQGLGGRVHTRMRRPPPPPVYRVR